MAPPVPETRLVIFQEDKFWSNEVAFSNILYVVRILLGITQPLIFWLKEEAPLNIELRPNPGKSGSFAELPISQELRSWLKEVAPSNMFEKSNTLLTSQSEIFPLKAVAL